MSTSSAFRSEGEEHTGRPGVVVSCDEGNRYSETVQVAFCTTQPKSNLPTHVEILSTGRASTVMCEQINTVSLERLGNYIGRCTAEEMRDIDIAVATALGLKKYPGLIERLKEREPSGRKAGSCRRQGDRYKGRFGTGDGKG